MAPRRGANARGEQPIVIPALVQYFQVRLAGTWVARVLARLHAARLARWWHDRKVVRRGIYQKPILGEPLTFSVQTQTHVMRIDEVIWELPVLERMASLVKAGDVVWDVGANVGIFSLVLARKGGSTVHAFEPESANIATLRQNIKLNTASNITLHKLALSDIDGACTFYQEGEAGSGTHSTVPDPGRTSASVQVQAARGDTLVEQAGLQAPAVVKIDVEGGELAVLRGMERLLTNHRVRHLFIEVHPVRLHQAGDSPEALRTLLTKHGYKLMWEHGRQSEVQQHFALEGED